VLLISKDFLNSKFVRETEVPRLLERRRSESLRIIPLIVRPCAWEAVDWLTELLCRPTDGRPLSKGSRHRADEDLAALTLEIRDLLRDVPGE
jgi:hypothetical protein